MSDAWVLAGDDDIPDRWSDPRMDDLRCICSNGLDASYSIGTALHHKPHNFPQCFPLGADGDAACTSVVLRRLRGPLTTKQREERGR